jgi:hypothetical protein
MLILSRITSIIKVEDTWCECTHPRLPSFEHSVE